MSEIDDAGIMTTERLVLCPLRSDDADEMATVLGDASLYELTGGHPLPVDELRLRYRRLALGRSDDGAQAWFNWIVRLRAGRVAVGTVQATVMETHAEVAWVVGASWQRRGIATEATAALVRWLEGHGIRTISANIHPRHTASQKVASRAGLQPTAQVVDGEQVWRWPVA